MLHVVRIMLPEQIQSNGFYSFFFLNHFLNLYSQSSISVALMQIQYWWYLSRTQQREIIKLEGEYEIWGLHCGEDSSCLLGCNAVQCCGRMPLFWRTLLHLFDPEDGGSNVLQNNGIILYHYTASQPRRPQLESRVYRQEGLNCHILLAVEMTLFRKLKKSSSTKRLS